MRVLITRPANRNKTLSEKIIALGATVELFPVIEIQPTPHIAPLKKAVQMLSSAHLALFVSQPAVEMSFPLINEQWPSLPAIQWGAIGPSTKKALETYGIPSVLCPLCPPYESESLLAITELQNVLGKKIFIFRGNGGRELLKETLTERGATVHLVEAYQRSLPKLDAVERIADWHHNPIDAIVLTSVDCLKNFLILVGHEIHWLKEIPIIVVGLRMHELVNKLGFKRTLVALDAIDASIIKVLAELKGQ